MANHGLIRRCIVGNEPMIKLVYKAVSQVTDKIIIAVNDPGRTVSYKSVIPNADYVIDDERFKGGHLRGGYTQHLIGVVRST